VKRYLAILAAAWLMLGLACLHDAAAENAAVMYVHVRDGTYLNGRHDPVRDSAVEMRLYRGDEVAVIGLADNWVQIEGGEAGSCWCCADYLADYPPDEDPPLYTVVSNGRVRVRQSPDGKTVRYVRAGDTVEVRFVIDGWAFLGDGYVMAEYLERSKEL
jgi:uncharacterized protein YgiM (DUF1202 family)